jgi:hypothetical protein
MIYRDKVMDLLIEVCPSFKNKWEEHLNDIWDRSSEGILYTDFAEFARHLSELVEKKEFDEFSVLFDSVEYILKEGDDFVQEAVVVGLLEDFQGNLERGGYDLNIIDKFLGLETKKYWIKVIKFWNGEIPYIDNN